MRSYFWLVQWQLGSFSCDPFQIIKTPPEQYLFIKFRHTICVICSAASVGPVSLHRVFFDDWQENLRGERKRSTAGTLSFLLPGLLFQVYPHIHTHFSPYKHTFADFSIHTDKHHLHEHKHTPWFQEQVPTLLPTHLGFGQNKAIGEPAGSGSGLWDGGTCCDVIHHSIVGSCTHADRYITVMCQLMK